MTFSLEYYFPWKYQITFMWLRDTIYLITFYLRKEEGGRTQKSFLLQDWSYILKACAYFQTSKTYLVYPRVMKHQHVATLKLEFKEFANNTWKSKRRMRDLLPPATQSCETKMEEARVCPRWQRCMWLTLMRRDWTLRKEKSAIFARCWRVQECGRKHSRNNFNKRIRTLEHSFLLPVTVSRHFSLN
jgi:hypothetical protein